MPLCGAFLFALNNIIDHNYLICHNIGMFEYDETHQMRMNFELGESAGSVANNMDSLFDVLGELPSEMVVPSLEEVKDNVEYGGSVELRIRAFNLLEALKQYSKASRNAGFIYAIEDDRPEVQGRFGYDEIEILEKSVLRDRALGSKALRAASGLKNPDYVGYNFGTVVDTLIMENDFRRTLIGPKPEVVEARAQLRKVLRNQIEDPKAKKA